MKNIIDLTLDAITASGKGLVNSEAMFMFLQRNGVSKKILIIFMIKLAIFVIIPEIKYIQVHQYSKHQKAPTMYQISILHR
jgi:hypothetical protein